MFIPSGSPITPSPYTVGDTGTVPEAGKVIHFSTSQASTLFSDSGRTTAANPGDLVRAWTQYGGTATDDVMDNWASGSVPTLIDDGSRLVLSASGTSTLRQNTHDDTATLANPLPSGNDPWFVWNVIATRDTSGGITEEPIVHWGSRTTNNSVRSATIADGDYEIISSGTSLASGISSTPSVFFAWYDGSVMRIQINNGTVQSTGSITLTVSSATNRSNGIGLFYRGFGSVNDVDLCSVGAYNRVLSVSERQSLYNFLVIDHNL